jgi:hypothetical protein
MAAYRFRTFTGSLQTINQAPLLGVFNEYC